VEVVVFFHVWVGLLRLWELVGVEREQRRGRWVVHSVAATVAAVAVVIAATHDTLPPLGFLAG
jgi:hypothetical protein